MDKVLTTPLASPYKSVVEELDVLRSTLETTCRSYLEQANRSIQTIQNQVSAAGAAADREPERPTGAARTSAAKRKAATATAKFHDLRDMLTLMRTLQVKPTEGRRKDLKKLESVLEDLREIVLRWS